MRAARASHVFVALALFLGFPGHVQAAREPKPKKTAKSSGDAPSPSAPSPSPPVPSPIAFSVTVNPFWNSEASGQPTTDAELHAACETMQQALHAEFTLREADGQLTWAVCGIEEGEENQRAHLQLCYCVMACVDGTSASKKRVSGEEKKWMKRIMDEAHPGTARVTYRVVKDGLEHERYIRGYCAKDRGLQHSIIFTIGVSEEEMRASEEAYMSKATGYFKSACKTNKTPHKKIRKQVAFKASNLFVLAAWFIGQHALEPIASSLTLSLTIAYALTTQRYRVDDTLVTGRTGEALDPTRASAFFELAMQTESNNVPLLVSLIDKVLYTSSPSPISPRVPGLPSPFELASKYSLAQAKELAHRTSCQSDRVRTGRAIVVDYLNAPESRAVAEAMSAAGLLTTTLFRTTQATPYQCGDNSAAWACMLRQMGGLFTDLGHAQASVINTQEFVAGQRVRLGKPATDTSWLDGDEIVQLVTLDNPDAPNTNPAWLSGPGPLNYFYTFFAQTLTEPHHRGRVRIMVVNTEEDRGVFTGAVGGRHWFVAAWYVDPDDPSDSTSNGART